MKKITFLSILFWVTVCFAWSPPADKLPSIQGALANPVFNAVIARKDAGGAAASASDTFDQGENSSLADDSDWTASAGAWIVQSGAAGPNSSDAYSLLYWSSDSFAADQYSQVTISALHGATLGGPAVRVNAGAGYAILMDLWDVNLYLLASSAPSGGAIWTDEDAGLSATDSVRLSVTGTGAATRLEVEYDTGSGFTSIASNIDPSTDVDSGSPGVIGYDDTWDVKFTDWAASDL